VGDPGGVEFVKAVLMELIKKKDFFPLSDYPINTKANGNGIIYSVCEDDGHPLVPFASVGMPINTSLARRRSR